MSMEAIQRSVGSQNPSWKTSENVGGATLVHRCTTSDASLDRQAQLVFLAAGPSGKWWLNTENPDPKTPKRISTYLLWVYARN